eukprot:487966-Rhodomonas_salina.1
METPSHILCKCNKLHEIITALHDKIWRCLFECLSGTLPGWSLHYDSPIGKMALTELTSPLTGSVRCGKPDGVAQRPSQNECFLLEFTSTTDFWPTSLDAALASKEDKKGYVDMLACLKEHLPGWDVRLLTFVLGDRGLMDENTWVSNLT